MENIALGKQVTQSSTAFGGDAKELWMAKSMVTMVTILSLIQTSNPKPWWQVDLAKEKRKPFAKSIFTTEQTLPRIDWQTLMSFF